MFVLVLELDGGLNRLHEGSSHCGEIRIQEK